VWIVIEAVQRLLKPATNCRLADAVGCQPDR